MQTIFTFIDVFVHLDRYLGLIIREFGVGSYLVVFAVIFCETGLVITPILPGDSLLFGLGYFASLGSLQLEWLILTLSLAAIAGDTVNYWVGSAVGPRIFDREESRFFRKEYLDRTHRFYERHGGKTIIIARFMPIIRTFAPFVAGIGSMTYRRFLLYNVMGGIAWVSLFTLCGFYFGNIPAVKDNFTLVIIAIVVLSVLPGVIEYFRMRRAGAGRSRP
jgi:membrane-associated protein